MDYYHRSVSTWTISTENDVIVLDKIISENITHFPDETYVIELKSVAIKGLLFNKLKDKVCSLKRKYKLYTKNGCNYLKSIEESFVNPKIIATRYHNDFRKSATSSIYITNKEEDD